MLFFPPAPQLCAEGCGWIINKSALILFSNPHNTGWKKQPCWKNIIHLSHHSWRFLTARSRKVQHRVVGVKQKPSLYRIKTQNLLLPRVSQTNTSNMSLENIFVFFLSCRVQMQLSRKKCYCCCHSYSGDNLKSFHDSRNDILDMLYIETEVYSLESATERDSVCFF